MQCFNKANSLEFTTRSWPYARGLHDTEAWSTLHYNQGPASTFSNPAKYRGLFQTIYAGWHSLEGSKAHLPISRIGDAVCHQQNPQRFIRLIVPPSRQDLPDHPQPGGTCYQTCHRSSLGQRRPGYFTKIFWLYRQQYQGKTHQFRIHRPYRWQIAASAEVFRSC